MICFCFYSKDEAEQDRDQALKINDDHIWKKINLSRHEKNQSNMNWFSLLIQKKTTASRCLALFRIDPKEVQQIQLAKAFYIVNRREYIGSVQKKFSKYTVHYTGRSYQTLLLASVYAEMNDMDLTVAAFGWTVAVLDTRPGRHRPSHTAYTAAIPWSCPQPRYGVSPRTLPGGS
jgi:hypothetical protein